jgi:hypothetical protein
MKQQAKVIEESRILSVLGEYYPYKIYKRGILRWRIQ